MKKEKNLFIEMIKKGEEQKEYNIIYLKNSYALVTVNDKFYYIQAEYFGGYTITLYNKISANKKKQAEYPKKFWNYKEMIAYILDTKNKKFNNLKDCYEQTIFYELSTIKNGITLFEHLKKIAGYREKEILKDLDYIKELQKDVHYHILQFISKSGESFEINCKDWDRLIVG